MLTEHALLDDNGDKQGSPEPARRRQGRPSRPPCCRSGSTAAAGAAGGRDSCARSMWSGSELERRIEALKLLKSGMDPEKYAAELEKLATDLALKSRADPRRGREGR